jgi:hypothetical protein
MIELVRASCRSDACIPRDDFADARLGTEIRKCENPYEKFSNRSTGLTGCSWERKSEWPNVGTETVFVAHSRKVFSN